MLIVHAAAGSLSAEVILCPPVYLNQLIISEMMQLHFSKVPILQRS